MSAHQQALAQLDHRPWPLPVGRWVMRQTWHDLLFAHWPVEASEVRHLVPSGVRVQEFDGTSWIGVVPFRLSGIARRGLPSVPGLRAFPELNVRLYVERDGKPGVWFLSLDATNPLAIWAAKRWFHLPYYRAAIDMHSAGDEIRFASHRRGGQAAAQFEAAYHPATPPQVARPGTLEHFLVERYCLYAQDSQGTLWQGEIHHAPWPLQLAAGKVNAAALLATHGIAVGNAAPRLHFSRRIDAVFWPYRRVDAADETSSGEINNRSRSTAAPRQRESTPSQPAN